MTEQAVGGRVSHYELVRRLGVGGMGTVYLARDLELDRQVAIKFLHAPADDHSRRRLRREARAAAALEHPHICGVHEVGTDEVGGDFIVMPYVEGETLAERLRRGPLPAADALTLAAQIADALAAAHREGIIHRDLKPQNILLTPDGQPKLLDFGISKRIPAAETPTVTQLTAPEALVGTPAYMAPEQLTTHRYDARTDLFSLGCVLFECLTGEAPFRGATPAAVYGAVLHVQPPPVSTRASAVPAGCDALVARLLSKTPATRFQNADELLGALRAVATATPRPAPSASIVHRRWLVAATAIVAVVAAWWMFGAGRVSRLPEPPPDAARWYSIGVEALRDATYAGARAAFEEAVRLFPDFPQAYSRLAEAHEELDDQRSAQAALIRVSSLVPNIGRLPAEERLRMEAVRASVLQDHEAAVAAIEELIALRPDDAGLRVDLGRAHEAGGRLDAARSQFARAVELDPQLASARLRLATAEGRGGNLSRAYEEFDEAIRLYRAASRPEGEAEAWLRKGIRQVATGDHDTARASLDRVIALTADRRFLSQQLRARFELARLTLAAGHFDEAETIAAAATAQADAAGLDAIAADGLIGLANVFMFRRDYQQADAQLERAMTLAHQQGAGRTEMRARLQQASLRLATADYAEALALAAEPLQYFTNGRYRQYEAQANNILSRAHEGLEQYEEAHALATSVLAYAESVGNQSLAAGALESLAGQRASLGRLPEALAARERIEAIHVSQADHASLKYDLPNRAALLLQLGRADEAGMVLDGVDAAIARGEPAYADRGPRVALLRAWLAATTHQYEAVERYASAVLADTPEDESSTDTLARGLREYARAQRGRSELPVPQIASWPARVTSAPTRRELAYWVARTLLARGARAEALSVALTALADPVVSRNTELAWRLTSIAATATADGPEATELARRSQTRLSELQQHWSGSSNRYLERPDLASLVRR